MRFRDLLRDINRHEQKLENVLLYVDFLDHELPIILLKDASLLILFQLSGLDYEGLSEEEKEQFSSGVSAKKNKVPMVRGKVPVMARPGSLDELAYATVAQLSHEPLEERRPAVEGQEGREGQQDPVGAGGRIGASTGRSGRGALGQPDGWGRGLGPQVTRGT